MKNSIKRPLLAATCVFVCCSTYAVSVGVQFGGSGSSLMNIYLNPTESAGGLAQTNWNVVRTVGGEAAAEIVNDITGELRDSAGNLTAVKLEYGGGGADDSWRLSNTAGLAPNLKLLSGEIKTHGSMTFTWRGLTLGSYEVYLYGAVDGGAATLSVTVGANTYYWTEPSANTEPLTQAAQSTDPGTPGTGNYMRFTGLSPAGDGTITITVAYVSGNGAEMAIGITGLQLVSSSPFPIGTTTPPSYTAKIGVEFSGANRGAATVLSPGETAGYVVQPNWNVIPTANGDVSEGTVSFLKDNATNYTAVALKYYGNDSWSTPAGRSSTDDRLMKGYLADDGTGGSAMVLTLTNLGAGPYDLYLYGNILGGPNTVSVALGANTYHWTEPPAFNGFYKQAPLSTDPGNPGVGNFLRLSGISPESGAITMTITVTFGSAAGISGLQLCSSSAFPVPTAAILPEPNSQVALSGSTISFVSGAIGVPPIAYQWQTNSAGGWVNIANGPRISGATGNTLTISNVASADALSYRLIATDGGVNSATSSVVSLNVVSEVIGVDFSGDDSTVGNVTARILPPSAVAGVLRQGNWNWVDNRGGGGGLGVSGFTVPLGNHLGIATLTRLAFDGNDAWFSSQGETTSNDGKMMKGVLKHEGADSIPITLTFTNLTAGESYDVYLYGNNSDGAVVMSVTVGANTYYWNLAQNFFGTFIEVPLSTDPGAPGSGNYLHLTGLLADVNGTVTISCAWASGAQYLGIAGVQIVKPTGFFPRTPVAINTHPAPSVLYAGRTVTFTVEAASGYLPLSYQWQVNTGGGWVNLVNDARISGATNATLMIANVSAADAYSYRVTVTDNNANSATSSPATLTTAAPPVPNSHASLILADGPLAHYRLNEAVGTTNVFDYVGGHNGFYQVNAAPGQPGVPNPPYAGFEMGNLSFQSSPAFQVNSYAFAPFGTLAGLSNVTFTMWVYPNVAPQAGSCGLIVDRTGPGGGGGLMFSGDGSQLRYQWNTNTASSDIITTTFDSGLAVPAGQWSFIALVISPDGANLYVYNASGFASATDPTPLAPQTFGNGWHIGQDMADANPNKAFDGLIDEVAIYGTSLSPEQINSLYFAANSGLSQSLSIVASGQNVVLTWPQGVLLQAPALTGPWTTNSAATSPYTNAALGSQFYRLLIPVNP